MVISIASGKGGTGKTLVSTNLASVLNSKVIFLDCDVEEPNSHIFIKPQFYSKGKVTIPIPKIDTEKCDFCGRCVESCVYNALAIVEKKVLSFPQLCHGCGSCSFVCPRGAITEVEKEIGSMENGFKDRLKFSHGKLKIGEVMSPALIRALKRNIPDTAKGALAQGPVTDVIIDAPPGTSCPVIATVKESDFCILVTEPTPFGLNDLVLAVELLREISIPFAVIVNRCDIGDDSVKDYCAKEGVKILMQIPFQREIAQAYSQGKLFTELFPEYRDRFNQVYDKILGILT